MTKPWWEMSYEEQQAAKPRNRLVALLTKSLDLNPRDAEKAVALMEEMIDEAKSDLDDRINQRGQYDPDY